MPRKKLTDRFVEHAPIPASGRVEYFDMLLPGFGLRVSDSGVKSWVVFYRVRGRQRRHTLERYPRMLLADARDVAREAIKRAALGQDPAAEKRRQQTGDGTVEAIGAMFIERYAKSHQPRSWQWSERILRVDVYPRLGAHMLADITKADVLDLLDKISDRGSPMAARNCFKVIRKLFRWAANDRGLLATNPLLGLKTPVADTKRDRVLSDDEIRALWKVWSDESAYGAACRVMLLTGQRVQEVAQLRRSEIDADGNWTIDPERYKTKIPHIVPLNAAARAIIETQAQVGDSDLVFTLSGDPLNGWSKTKARMDSKAGVEGWQLRDLRRTARTLMTRHGVDFFIAERAIGHVIGGVGGVYDRYGYLAEKRRALETLANAIEMILKPPMKGSVVPIRAAGVGSLRPAGHGQNLG
jgi:integrase